MMTVSQLIFFVCPHSGGMMFFNQPNPISIRRHLYGVDLTRMQPIIAFNVSKAIWNQFQYDIVCLLLDKENVSSTTPVTNTSPRKYLFKLIWVTLFPSILLTHLSFPSVIHLKDVFHFRTCTTYQKLF